MIKIQNVCAGYFGKEVLHSLDLNVESGKVTVIIGPNGCGKSTLLKTLIRLNPLMSGSILVDDHPIGEYSSSGLAQKIAYISQSRKTPDITVSRMVLHGRFPYLKYPRRYREEDFKIVDQTMERVGIKDLSNENVSELSGGMQQKVYIAMALAQNTPVILMDEPTVFLDISHQLKMLNMAKELANEGKTVVMVLHDLTQAFSYADEIVLMSDGRCLMQGTPENVYNSGKINEIFNIEFCRMSTSDGWKYFYK